MSRKAELDVKLMSFPDKQAWCLAWLTSNRFFETLLSMVLSAVRETGSKFARAIAGLLLITVFALFLPYSIQAIFEQSRFNAISKTPAQSLDWVKKKTTNRLAMALNEAQVSLFFDSYPHLLGFDLKQNLRTWPVLSNDLERAPPFSGSL